MPNWEEIKKEWESSEISFKELAEKHGLKDSTIRSRKNREKWQRGNVERNATPATQRKKNVATKKEEFEPVVLSEDMTDKQRLFCIYYIKYFNATKAYQKAYRCSYEVAMSSGSRLMKNVEITQEIDRLKAEQMTDLKLDVRDVLQKYIDIAFADITDFATFGKREVPVIGMYGPVLDENEKQLMQEVNYVDFKESQEVDGTIITEVKQGKDGISVKLADKMRALEQLSKYFDLLSDNDKKRMQEEKLKVEIEKGKLELGNLRGDTEGDPHAQGSSYEDALNAQTEDVFADEVMDDEA